MQRLALPAVSNLFMQILIDTVLWMSCMFDRKTVNLRFDEDEDKRGLTLDAMIVFLTERFTVQHLV